MAFLLDLPEITVFNEKRSIIHIQNKINPFPLKYASYLE